VAVSVVQLGPRASLLLGLLDGPRTVNELAERVDQALGVLASNEELNYLIGEETRPALQAISEGGKSEIRRLLSRLERTGFVRRQTIDGENLWWRYLPPGATA
jgi:hypothetical protein